MFTKEDYAHRRMTLKDGNDVVTADILIQVCLPIIYISDEELVLKDVENIPAFNSMRSTLSIIDTLEDGTLRYKFLQKFRGVSNNREGMLFYDRLLKDMFITPSLDGIIINNWTQQRNYGLKGYKVGGGKDNTPTFHKTEIQLGFDILDFVDIPEPEPFTGKTHLLDAYGVQPGDSGTHLNDVIYYERPKVHNGDEVNFGIQRYQTDTTNMLSIGKISDMYPGGLTQGIPIYGIVQPSITYFSAELLGKRVIPNPDDKLYILVDI